MIHLNGSETFGPQILFILKNCRRIFFNVGYIYTNSLLKIPTKNFLTIFFKSFFFFKDFSYLLMRDTERGTET